MERPNRRNQRYCDHCNSLVSRGTHYNHRILYGKKHDSAQVESEIENEGATAEEPILMGVMEEHEPCYPNHGRQLELET